MYFLGVDPDMQRTAIAAVDHLGNCVGVWVVRARKKATEHAGSVEMVNSLAEFIRGEPLPGEVLAVAVEGQEIAYTARAGKNPRSVAFLGPISGASLSALRLIYPKMEDDTLFLPPPAAWKGTVPKAIHQARTYTRLGWGSKVAGKGKDAYAIPANPPVVCVGIEDISRGEWKHVGDAVGLALWAREQFIKLHKRRGTMLPVGFGNPVLTPENFEGEPAAVVASSPSYDLAQNPSGAATPAQGEPAHEQHVEIASGGEAGVQAVGAEGEG